MTINHLLFCVNMMLTHSLLLSISFCGPLFSPGISVSETPGTDFPFYLTYLIPFESFVSPFLLLGDRVSLVTSSSSLYLSLIPLPPKEWD